MINFKTNLDRYDDKELIKKTLDGDLRSFDILVHKYEKSVAAITKSMLGDVPEAKDVGQEVFIRFYKSLKSFRHESGVKTYLVRIAINLSLNELKKRKRINSRFIQLNEKENYFEMDDQEIIEHREIIEYALNKLDSRMRSVVLLRMLEGYSTKETAEILRIPQGTVLSRLSRAHDILRELLKEKL